jgi:hypothetical protein
MTDVVFKKIIQDDPASKRVFEKYAIERNADSEAYLIFSRVSNRWNPPLITEYVLNPNNAG